MKLKKIFGIIAVMFLFSVYSMPVGGETSDKVGSYTVVTSCSYKYMEGYHNGYSVAANSSGKYGLVDMKGLNVIPYKYDSLNFAAAYYDKGGTVKNLYCASLKGKYGIIDSSGSRIIPFIYDNNNDNKWAIDFENVNNLYTAPLKSIRDIFFKITVNGKAGLLDSTGKSIIPAQYDSLSFDYYIGSDNKKHGFVISYKNKKYYLFNSNGKSLLSGGYDLIKNLGGGQILFGTGNIQPHNNGDPVITQGNGEVYDLAHNKIIFKSSKNSTLDFGYGQKYYIYNQNDGTSVVIDRAGRTIIKGGSYFLYSFYDEGFIVEKRGKDALYYGLVGLNGKLVLPLKYQSIGYFKNGVALAKMNNRYGVITKSFITPFIYTNGGVYDNGVYELTKDNKTIIYNKNGTVIGEAGKYTGVAGVCGKLTLVKSGDKIGAIDTDGKVVTPMEYDSFIEIKGYYPDPAKCLVVLEKNGVYFAINIDGQVILRDMSRELAGSIAFKGGYIYYYDAGMNTKIFNRAGKLLIEKKVTDFYIADNGDIIVYNDSGCALLDKNCKTIIDFGEFDGISPCSDGVAIVRMNGLYGIIKLAAQ